MPESQRELDTLWRELKAAQEIVGKQGETIAVIKKLTDMIFGNGQPGMLQQVKERLDGHDKQLQDQKKYFYMAMGAFAAWHFLTDSGVVSLQSLVKVLNKTP